MKLFITAASMLADAPRARTVMVACRSCGVEHAAGELMAASVAVRVFKCPHCGGHDLDTAGLQRAGLAIGARNERMTDDAASRFGGAPPILRGGRSHAASSTSSAASAAGCAPAHKAGSAARRPAAGVAPDCESDPAAAGLLAPTLAAEHLLATAAGPSTQPAPAAPKRARKRRAAP